MKKNKQNQKNSRKNWMEEFKVREKAGQELKNKDVAEFMRHAGTEDCKHFLAEHGICEEAQIVLVDFRDPELLLFAFEQEHTTWEEKALIAFFQKKDFKLIGKFLKNHHILYDEAEVVLIKECHKAYTGEHHDPYVYGVISNYLKNRTLSDDAELELAKTGETEWIEIYAERYQFLPEAEVELCKRGEPELIYYYRNRYELCEEAVEELKKRKDYDDIISYTDDDETYTL